MDLLIGTFTGLLTIFLYCLFERKNIKEIKKVTAIFFLFILFLSFIYKPSLNTLEWIGISPLLYITLDDIRTKSFNILIPIVVSIFFFILDPNLFKLCFTLGIFLISLIVSKISKESFFGEGDSYLLLPTFIILGLDNGILALYISAIIGVFFSVLIYLRYKQVEFPYLPYLLTAIILVDSNWYVEHVLFFGTIIFVVLSIIYILYKLIIKFKDKSNNKK